MQKAALLIKPNRIVIDCVRNDAASTGYLGGRDAALHGVRKQLGSNAGALQSVINRETSDQQQWNALWHAPAQLRIRQHHPLFRCGRDGVVADDALRRIGGTNDVCARGESFTRKRSVVQPLVERRMFPILESG